MQKIEIAKYAIFGFAVADAFGVPAEFIPREKLSENPFTEMVGYRSHNVPKGSWSDDTSMTLCTLESIAQHGRIDFEDIMFKFRQWLSDGYMTPHGKPFGIGRTCLHAIMNHRRGTPALQCGSIRESENGNGSLMRILPISLYNYFTCVDTESAIANIHSASALTHAHERSLIACGIYDFIVRELLDNPQKSSVITALKKADEYYREYKEHTAYERLFNPDFALTEIDAVNSSGYVVDTLEAALWCLLTTTNYKDCIIKAVNLGQDTDTIAAVAGGLAAIVYGQKQIPTEWTDCLIKKDDITKLCTAFCDAFRRSL